MGRIPLRIAFITSSKVVLGDLNFGKQGTVQGERKKEKELDPDVSLCIN